MPGFRILLAAALAAVIARGFAADGAVLVDAADVAQAAARGAILWDVRAAAEYRKGHIPGAVTIGDAGKVLRDENSEDFVATSRIEAMLGEAGIDPSREVIVYGNRGSAVANFGRYALHYFGGRNVRVYHDGVEGWSAAGKALATEETRLPPVKLNLVANAAATAGTAEMAHRARKGDLQIVDARTPREYAGEDIRAIRGGHIPGAVNIPYEHNWKDPATADKLARRQVADNSGMTLKSRDELKRLYARLDPDKETVVYCQSGVRAAQTAQVLEDLGFSKVRVYDSSWLGYAARLDAPAANETFFNVGLMNGRMAALMRRVEDLERALAEARSLPAGAAGCAPGQRC